MVKQICLIEISVLGSTFKDPSIYIKQFGVDIRINKYGLYNNTRAK